MLLESSYHTECQMERACIISTETDEARSLYGGKFHDVEAVAKAKASDDDSGVRDTQESGIASGEASLCTSTTSL